MNSTSRCVQGSYITTIRLCTIALLALAVESAEAGPIVNFNSLSSGINSTSSEDAIENHIEAVTGIEVTLYTGTKTLRGEPEAGLSSVWLGNSDYVNGVLTPHAPGVRDTYLINRWNETSISSSLRDRIKIYFHTAITSIEFDWQIFPTLGTKADLTVKGDGTTYFYYNNIANKTVGKLGHTLITFNAPTNLVEFIDWYDAPIGIDNLHINPPPPPQTEVPEPATGVLMLLGGMGIAAVRRRRQAAA